jgi:hypothetical protein
MLDCASTQVKFQPSEFNFWKVSLALCSKRTGSFPSYHFSLFANIRLIWCYKYAPSAVDTSFSNRNRRIIVSSPSCFLIPNIRVWHHTCDSYLHCAWFIALLHSIQILWPSFLSYSLGSFLSFLLQNDAPDYVMNFCLHIVKVFRIITWTIFITHILKYSSHI